MKGKNTFLQCRISQKIRRQRTAKFIMVNFYEMDFMKDIVVLVRVDKIYNILKSLPTTGYQSRDESGFG